MKIKLGIGKGWFKDSKRHSNARLYGKAGSPYHNSQIFAKKSLFKKNLVRRIAGIDEDSIVREFFKRRFKKDPNSPIERSYFAEWKQRFKTGNPEAYMDSESKEVYKKMKNEYNLTAKLKKKVPFLYLDGNLNQVEPSKSSYIISPGEVELADIPLGENADSAYPIVKTEEMEKLLKFMKAHKLAAKVRDGLTKEDFKQAMQGEGWAIGDYQDMVARAKTGKQRKVLKHIMGEEKEHLGELIELTAKLAAWEKKEGAYDRIDSVTDLRNYVRRKRNFRHMVILSDNFIKKNNVICVHCGKKVTPKTGNRTNVFKDGSIQSKHYDCAWDSLFKEIYSIPPQLFAKTKKYFQRVYFDDEIEGGGMWGVQRGYKKKNGDLVVTDWVGADDKKDAQKELRRLKKKFPNYGKLTAKMRKFKKGDLVNIGGNDAGKIVNVLKNEIEIHWIGDPTPEAYAKKDLKLEWNNKRKLWQ